jgi:alpha-ketoglutarate-dependent taurine dioxygenase
VTITPLRDRNCFCVEPVTGALGAEITGLDLSKPLDDESVSALKDAFHEHLVLFFRDQIITLEQQKIFARHFGNLELNDYIGTLEGHPEVIEVIKESEGPQRLYPQCISCSREQGLAIARQLQQGGP